MPVTGVDQKITGLLGLARRGGLLVAGDHAVRYALQRKKAALVIVARDAGKACRRRFDLWTRRAGVPLYVYGDKAGLGAIAGRAECAVVAVRDRGLAAAVEQRLRGAAARPGAESGGEPFVSQHSRV